MDFFPQENDEIIATVDLCKNKESEKKKHVMRKNRYSLMMKIVSEHELNSIDNIKKE